jgi:hypothetical protein
MHLSLLPEFDDWGRSFGSSEDRAQWRWQNSNPYFLFIGRPSCRALYDGFPYEMDRSRCIAAMCAPPKPYYRLAHISISSLHPTDEG